MNIDIAPTIAELAGIEMESDGTSLVPAMQGPVPSWRRVVPLEWVWRGLVNYSGTRTRFRKRVSWEDGFQEEYDLRRDPYELERLSTHWATTGGGPMTHRHRTDADSAH